MFRNILRRCGARFDQRPRSLRHVQRCRVEQLEDRRLLAITAQMVKDINAAEIGAAPEGWAETPDFVFFSALDDAHGRELWKHNRADGSTELVADVNPGIGGAEVRELTAVGDRVFFIGYDDLHGREIWVSDGTSIGTKRLTNFDNAHGSTDVRQLAASGDALYFVEAPSGANAQKKIWRTDGTVAGTRSLRNIAPNADYGVPLKLIDVNGTLFFCAMNDTELVSLWKTDGTTGGTALVRDDLGTGTTGSIGAWTAFGDRLIFSTQTNANYGIWISDGEFAGTQLLKAMATAVIVNIDGEVYFTGREDNAGYQIWKTDGSVDGTQQLTHLTGFSNGQFGALTKYRDDIFFVADIGRIGFEPWKLDDSAAGASLVKEILPGIGCSVTGNCQPRSAGIIEIAEFHDTMYFRACDDEAGCELWSSDGTEAGTQRFTDLRLYDHCFVGYCHVGSSDPRTLQVFDGALYFVADDGLHGRQLWRMEAEDLEPRRASDIRYGSLPADIEYLTEIGDEVWFVATDTIHGREVWRSDGTSAGTVMVKDIAPGQRGSIGGQTTPEFVESNGVVYFVADDGVHGEELWRSDGTEAGTYMLKDIFAGLDRQGLPYSSRASGMIAFGGGVAFRAYDGESPRNFWISDGTTEGTRNLRRSGDAEGGLRAGHFTTLNGQLLFRGSPNNKDEELWRSDGTSEGTVLVKDLRTDVDQFGNNLGSYVHNFMQLDDKMYFVAWGTGVGYELWVTDGTSQGTSLVRDLFPGEGASSPEPLAIAGGRLYFTAVDAMRGRQLWAIDQRGKLIRLTNEQHDPSTGSYAGTIAMAVEMDGMLYYVPAAGPHYGELWRSDGTRAGTVMVADTSAEISWYSSLINASGTLFFVGHDWDFGNEIWMSDGTAEGTRRATDIAPESGSAILSLRSFSLASAGGKVFAVADDGLHGTELWTIQRPLGDTNFDGSVNLADLQNVRNHLGETGNVRGDVNGDGVVNIVDLNEVRNHYGGDAPDSRVATPRHERFDRMALARDAVFAMHAVEDLRTSNRVAKRRI